jgi:hypothetical protein
VVLWNDIRAAVRPVWSIYESRYATQDVSATFMDERPEKRPTMSNVLDRLARYTVNVATRLGSPR